MDKEERNTETSAEGVMANGGAIEVEIADSLSAGLSNGSELSSPDLSKRPIPAPPAQAPALPPRSSHPDAPVLPPRKRAPFFWLRGNKSQGSSISISSESSGDGIVKKRSGSSVNQPDYDLLLSRLDANNEGFQARKGSDKDSTLHGIRQLQQNFEFVREDRKEHGVHDEIDWEFWSSVVEDFPNFAKTKPNELSIAIASGFPPELRGLIWQLIASSKSSSLEELYHSIIQEQSSPHEKAIRRDLSRTSFIKNANSDSLFNIIKGYSLFDPEVGYTQGMAFIAVPLLINMSEPEAFCLLVHLMKDYDFRSMFLPEMPGLHVRLYQFDRLLEDTIPEVHIHLARQGVRSSMYASQWFLTLFAYKFPLLLVMRIFDIVIAEGIEAILRFGVALIRNNASTILSLEFDALLTFLKEKIFDYYLLENNSGNELQYSVHDLVSNAFEVRILPLTLKKYENEYIEIHRIERDRIEEVEGLRSSNGQLTLQVRRLETSLAALNQEHIQVANEMVQGKLEIARLQDENENLTGELAELKKLTEETADLADATLREQMTAMEAENAQLTETNAKLQEQVGSLESELVDVKMKLATLDGSHSQLRSRWDDLRKHFEGTNIS